MSTYLYGVVRRDHPRKLGDRTGVGSPPTPLRMVEADELVAIVSDAPENLRAKRRDLLAHEEVLEELCTQGATLPMRFGIVGDDDEAVSREVGRNAENYHRLLTELDGRIEVNVKAKHHEDAVLRQVLLEDDKLRSLNDRLRDHDGGSYDERVQFGEMVSRAVEAREARDAEAIAQQLRGKVVQERSGPAVDGCFLNISFLLEGPDVQEFQSTVDELRTSLDWLLELRVRGPLPPYSFTDIGQD